jgi:hypothetical protein
MQYETAREHRMKRGGNTENLKPAWKAGQSGNPNGRPKKVVDVAAIARDSSDKAMTKLAKLIDSDDERIALQAAIAVLDRAVGKPKQTIEKTGKREAADYDAAELLTIARMGSTRVTTSEDGEGKPDRLQ